MNLMRVKLKAAHNLPHLKWAKDLELTLPNTLATHLFTLKQHEAEQELSIDAELFNSETINLAKINLDKIRLYAAYTNTPPISSLLPINYQYLPSFVRNTIARLIGRTKQAQIARWANFPAWPLDLSSDFIADLSAQKPSYFTQGRTPVLLSHDIDSPEGLTNAVQYFLDIEEAVGARSANYIVPSAWKINHSKLNMMFERGHEIGIHGFNHSNKTPFLSSKERQKRLLSALPLIKKYHIKGYRAPSLLRTRELLQDLATIYCYDSSIPTSGGAFPVPNNGCASARPFRVEGLWEIPLSMPRDGSLLFLGYSSNDILNTWIQCANLIAKSGGVVNLLTHCENRFSGKSPMRAIYKQFLEYLALNGQFKFMLPRDLIELLEEQRI